MNTNGPGGRTRIRYRYRTAAIAGPWRATRERALADAVKARQAEADASQPDGVRWRLPGRIEMDRRGAGE
jgi:hypothetical protein